MKRIAPLLLLLTWGCAGTVAAVSGDASAAPDVVDVVDVPDAIDARDGGDATDAVDAIDARDVIDATDAVDVVDVVDVPDALDVPPTNCAVSTCLRGYLRSQDGGEVCIPGGVQPGVELACEGGRFCDGRGGCTIEQRSCPDPRERGCGVQAIPGGEFVMGRGRSWGGGTLPTGVDAPQRVRVSSFTLDQYEVTLRRFQRWIAAGRPLPSGPIAYRTATLTPTRPSRESSGIPSVPSVPSEYAAAWVSYWEAHAFCVWDGGRLPTGAEWEYAAVGVQDGRPYPRYLPWGDAFPNLNPIDCLLTDYVGSPGPARPVLPVCGDPRYPQAVDLSPLWGGMSAQAGGTAEWVVSSWRTPSLECVAPPTVMDGVAVDPFCSLPSQTSSEVRGGYRRDIGVYELESGNRLFRLNETQPQGMRCLRLRPGQ